MNEVNLLGLRNIKTDEVFDKNKDYGIFLIASLVETAYPCTFEDTEKDYIKYKLRIDRVDSIFDLKDSKPINFQHGKSPSQQLRWRVIQELGETEYENYMKWLLANSGRLADEYREYLETLKK